MCSFFVDISKRLWGKPEPKPVGVKEVLKELLPAKPAATIAPWRNRVDKQSFLVGAATTILVTSTYRRYFKRIKHAGWVTPDMLLKKRWIKGQAVRIGDADNFRLYHTPAFGWRWPLRLRKIPEGKGLVNQTIHVRLAGVDAPEGPHWGNAKQKHHDEAMAWLKEKIEGKVVYCQLLSKERHGRVVGLVYLKPRWIPFKGENVSIAMLRAGWAETYTQSGAEYGDLTKEDYLAIQSEAQDARLGMWVNGKDIETPADYKRRTAAQKMMSVEEEVLPDEVFPEDVTEALPPADGVSSHTKPGLLRRLFGGAQK